MTKLKAPPKLVLSASRNIPFDRLVLAQSNVRRLKAGLSIEELAEDIARRTLLQSLNARPILDADGSETGRFEVPAGGRRYRALELLVKQKRLARNAPIPCVVRTEGSAEEDSLAENVQRMALHPLDQFRAFQTLREQGLGDETIAARFFVSVQVVRQRLKLAAASPRLLDLFGEGELSLEQLMAFCVSDDHSRQEQVWEALRSAYNREPYLIRRMLTEHAVQAGDPRVRFVGLEAYEAAGGTVLRDLFQQDQGGWLQDPALLDRLAREKLAAAAETVRQEGWRWVEASLDFPYGHQVGMRRLVGTSRPLTEAERAADELVQAEYDALVEAQAGEEEISDEAEARLNELEDALAAIEARPPVYDPAEIATAGAFVSIDRDGRLEVERGYVREADEAAEDGSATSDATKEAGSESGASGKRVAELATDEDGVRPLAERLVTELTAYRTLALRDALAADPEIASVAILHACCLAAYYRNTAGSCLEVNAKQTEFKAQAPGLGDTAVARAIEARHAEWEQRLPRESGDLWAFLLALDAGSRAQLLAHCVALTVNAVREPWNRRSAAMAHADQLAAALGLDLAATGWAPTVENYLGRVTKAHIVEAVREAKGDGAVQLIEHLKKADMAREAERLLAHTRWLPELLRAAAPDALPEALSAADPLPSFLRQEPSVKSGETADEMAAAE